MPGDKRTRLQFRKARVIIDFESIESCDLVVWRVRIHSVVFQAAEVDPLAEQQAADTSDRWTPANSG
jgi:hypothetical protein